MAQWSKAKLSPDPEVIFTNLKNGEAFLLHLGANQYFSLNGNRRIDLGIA